MSKKTSPDSEGTIQPTSGMRKWFEQRFSSGKLEKRELLERIARQEDQIRLLTASIKADQIHSQHLGLLEGITRELEVVLDQPVAAQLVVNAIQKSFAEKLAAVYSYDSDKDEFSLIAVAGKDRSLPPLSIHLPANQGVIGKAALSRKSVVDGDLRPEADPAQPDDHPIRSAVAVPLVVNGQLKGMLAVYADSPEAFSTLDAATFEIAAEQLAGAWERAAYHQRLSGLIQAGTAISGSFELEEVRKQVAEISRTTLEASFAFVVLLDQEGKPTLVTHAGSAPLLLRSLRKDPDNDPLIQAALKEDHVIRIRDIRNFDLSAHLKADHAEYTNLLAFPLQVHHISVGAVLVFGKVGQQSFSESDESLASLIATQAGVAVDNSRLYQELSSSLQTATLQYQLSIRVMQAEDLTLAAEAIAESTYHLGHVASVGIVLFTPDRQVQTQVEVDKAGKRPGSAYPTHLVNEALRCEQTVVLSEDHSACKVCVPLQTPHQVYGALWMDIPEGRHYTSRFASSLQTLANQATVALERLILLVRTRNQTRELEATYDELETTYDQTLFALTSALDARDHETEGHSKRVGEMARRLGEELGLSAKQLKALERGGLLHDIGKIGISDGVLLKTGPLNSTEWQTMRQHPEIGARIVERVPFLSDTIPIVRYHHERWDGSGYPVGLGAAEIPLLARIFAVVDTFDALISDRPYRKKISQDKAGEFLAEQSGKLYDPEIVSTFKTMLETGRFNDVLRH